MQEMQVRRRKWKEMQVWNRKTCLGVGCAGEVGRWQGCERAQPTYKSISASALLTQLLR